MTFVKSIVLGMTQGISEFLPISSSAHLVFMQYFLGIKSSQVLFDVLLHFSTALVVIILYRNEIWQILKNFLKYKQFKTNVWSRTFWLLFIASIPTAVIGLFFKDYFQKVFENISLVAVLLLVTGTLIWGIEKFSKKKDRKNILEITIKEALFVGLMQGIAILPGISRSGITICAGLFCGWKREETVRFSFLLALPAILGANCLQFRELDFSGQEILLFQYLAGMVFAFVFGYISLKLLIQLLKNRNLILFSYYCWILGLIVIASV
ncbi:undecaprenyl-diphosphate phosphatase [bacterium]|nr:undecaprenyl-diphosphate phosphatase [bacterium]